MPPTDSTPNLAKTSHFEHSYSLKAFDKVPVHEYISRRTGMTVVIAEIDGPIVNGFFCLATEAFDDDGLPHTLEHLIFLGSEDYPYKGVLDLLANRCLASGTNAWTDVDHTCYTMETAGSEGFLTLMPIFIEHILYPLLTEQGFITEVHHVTGEGDDAGVVYCEIQDSENSAEERMYKNMARSVYPGKCGYSSATGGAMKNLRESTTNTKVRNYHKEFYRPENLKVIITGQVKPNDVFKALEPLEDKIIAKGERGEFVRPWQSEVPPMGDSKDLTYLYPSDEEKNGIYSIAWRGPSAVNDQYAIACVTILMKYLTTFSISPLQKEFIEIPDPYASKISFSIHENSVTCINFVFQNVPIAKLQLIKPKLNEIFKRIVDNEEIDMEQLKNIIIRYKLENLSTMENSPHYNIAHMIIGHMLYGTNKDDLRQRINPLIDLEKMLREPKSFWINFLRKYFVENNAISIQGAPSIQEQQDMAAKEKQRIEDQIKALGKEGLMKKSDELEAAVAFNEREPPKTMLTSVPVPSITSINFHMIQRFTTKSADKRKIDLSNTPVFTYFDHVNTNFAYIFALMDTSSLPSNLRLYLPLLLETIFESPILRDGKEISHEDVVTELNNDTISICGSLGLDGGKASSFKCGSYSTTANIMLQVESSKYNKGISWIRELLYQTIFNKDRLKIMATKMVNNVAQAKRKGVNVVLYAMKNLNYLEDSNVVSNGILKQHAFLTKLLEKLESSDFEAVLNDVRKVMEIITSPSNLNLYCAANLDVIKNASAELTNIFPESLQTMKICKELNVTPDFKVLKESTEKFQSNCIIGVGCLESSFMYQSTPSINSYLDPDLPALLLYIQYLIQAEGPLWKQVRGKGFSYSYSIKLNVSEGLLYLLLARSANVVAAYKESIKIVQEQLEDKVWDTNLMESAKKSLIFELIDEEKTIGDVVSLSLKSYFQGVEYDFSRKLLQLVDKVTAEELNAVGSSYIAPLFDHSKVKTVVVTDPAKVEEIQANFAKLNHPLTVYSSLEESFLKC